MKIEKFCPSVVQCIMMQSSGFLPLSSLHRTVIASWESIFFFFEIFQNPFEKLCPSVPWGSPVRHFWVIFALLDFWVELGFRGRFLTVGPGSRLLGHPTGGGSILIASYRTPPYKTVSDSIFDLRVDFRVSGRSSVVGPKSSITGPPEIFS